MMCLRPLVFNGKFYAGQLNGVHRVADRLIRQADRILGEMPAAERPAARIYLPRKRAWQPTLNTIEIVEQDGAHSQKWEQFTLPRLAADGVLINLCNLAPLRHDRKLLLIHDAQFLFSDSSYPLRQRLGYKYLIPMMAHRSRCVMTVSHYSQRLLDVTGISDQNRTAVLYNGADHMLDAVSHTATLSDLGLSAQQYVIVFGTSKAYKNVEIVFRAFQNSALGDQRLVVIGEDATTLRRGGLVPPDNAIFAGPVNDGALRALYEHATCLVFPSKTEGFGLPPIEAMLLGCPVVAAPAGAIPEVCRDAVAYASVDDPDEWVDAITSLASDADLRARKIREGRIRAESFTWAAAGQRLITAAIGLADGEN